MVKIEFAGIKTVQNLFLLFLNSDICISNLLSRHSNEVSIVEKNQYSTSDLVSTFGWLYSVCTSSFLFFFYLLIYFLRHLCIYFFPPLMQFNL